MSRCLDPISPLGRYFGAFLRGFPCLSVGFLFFFLVGGTPLRAVPIAGANGRVVDFAGIKSAGPAGLKVQIQTEGDLVDVAWDKLDLERLKSDHPGIFAAFEAAKMGKDTVLNLGSFASTESPPRATPPTPAMPGPGAVTKIAGRIVTEAGGGKFAIHMPPHDAPKGVILLAMGQNGNSARFLGEPEKGRWSAMSKKFKLAVMAYEFPDSVGGLGANDFKTAPFVAAEGGSGAAVLSALENFSKLSGRPELATAPIAVFGQDVLGAGFAYNFCQAFPERVIAAVVAKGAFYSAQPTEASAKVPVLILWGEYDDEINLWKPDATHQTAHEAGLPLRANWVYVMEPRGGAGDTPQSFHLAMTFLDRMILARLNPEGQLQDLGRSRSFVGDLDSLKISRMENPDAVLKSNKTWLPDGEIAKLWEDFSNGVLAVPHAGGGGQ